MSDRDTGVTECHQGHHGSAGLTLALSCPTGRRRREGTRGSPRKGRSSCEWDGDGAGGGGRTGTLVMASQGCPSWSAWDTPGGLILVVAGEGCPWWPPRAPPGGLTVPSVPTGSDRSHWPARPRWPQRREGETGTAPSCPHPGQIPPDPTRSPPIPGTAPRPHRLRPSPTTPPPSFPGRVRPPRPIRSRRCPRCPRKCHLSPPGAGSAAFAPFP